jgi:predicted glycogen debranching enzyme
MIKLNSEICTDLSAASGREWLETNGIGGFASGTVSGVNTRRYHGLLVAATKPPVGRAVLLSKFEEVLTVDGQIYELSANKYPGSVHPNGYKCLQEFRLEPFPVWVFEVAGVRVEKTVFMLHGENTTVIDYEFQLLTPESNISFELKPLVAFRDYHHLGHQTDEINADFVEAENHVCFKPFKDYPQLALAFENATVEKTGYWYRNFEYAIELERGFDFREDLFQPFSLKFDLSNREKVSVIASTEVRASANAEIYRQFELERRSNLVKKAGYEDDFLQHLVLVADDFIVSRGEEKSIIAGYHWFSDWGRDTMIALPGLTLSTNNPDIAKSILLEFSKHISQGMLPNRFPDVGDEPEYNTVDATLWYFEAIRAWLENTGDYDFVRENLFEKLVEIIAWHLRGTRYEIHVDTDGLLHAGEEGVQLTWMDAKVGDWVVTPRIGKPVEIQALWYNALRIMEHLADKFNDKAGKYQYCAIADMAQISFNQKFWNEAEECLYDVVEETSRDGSIRPNQIFAVSLKYSMLPLEKAKKVVQKVENELLTPVGLRSLSPRDKDYRPRYTGDGVSRDSAYHQGTVWAWLLGPFFTAYAKSFADEPETKIKLNSLIEGLKPHLTEAGLGQFSEIFDAEPPYTPRGCIAQAWSVAEILRAASSVGSGQSAVGSSSGQ